MNRGHHIPRASRPFESPMTLAVRNSRVTIAPDTSLRPAGADVAEADTAQRVATHPSVIDAERHPLYGHGVHDEYSDLDDELYQEHVALRIAQFAAEAEAEKVRRARLSRWQEQR